MRFEGPYTILRATNVDDTTGATSKYLGAPVNQEGSLLGARGVVLVVTTDAAGDSLGSITPGIEMVKGQGFYTNQITTTSSASLTSVGATGVAMSLPASAGASNLTKGGVVWFLPQPSVTGNAFAFAQMPPWACQRMNWIFKATAASTITGLTVLAYVAWDDGANAKAGTWES